MFWPFKRKKKPADKAADGLYDSISSEVNNFSLVNEFFDAHAPDEEKKEATKKQQLINDLYLMLELYDDFYYQWTRKEIWTGVSGKCFPEFFDSNTEDVYIETVQSLYNKLVNMGADEYILRAIIKGERTIITYCHNCHTTESRPNATVSVVKTYTCTRCGSNTELDSLSNRLKWEQLKKV